MLMAGKRLSIACAGAVFLFFHAGCSSSTSLPGKTTPVEGTIKMDGTPLVGVRVEFVPEDGKAPGSTGITDENGHYVLRTGDGREGALVGKSYVTLFSERADERSKKAGSPRPVPQQYSLTTSGNPLGAVDVSESKKIYDFDIQSK